MKKSPCCECCGGSLKMLGNLYIKCEYCGQVYYVSEDGGPSIINTEDVYQDALKLQKTGIKENLKEAANLFEILGVYKDSDVQVLDCLGSIRQIEIEEEEKRLSRLRTEELEKINRQKQFQRNKKIAFYFVTILVGMMICLLIAFSVSTSHKRAREEKYVTALAEYSEEKYEKALVLFKELNDYKDASLYVKDIQTLMEESKKIYEEAKVLYEVEEYGKALDSFSSIRFYSDSEAYIEQICDAIMLVAKEYLKKEDYDNAKALIALIPKDSNQYNNSITIGKEIERAENAAEEARQAAILQENYKKALELYNASDYISAQSMFMELNGYEQSVEYLDNIGNMLYEQAKALYEAGDYLDCANVVKGIDDSAEWVNYQMSNELLQRAKNDYTSKVNEKANKILMNENYDAMCNYLNSVVCELYTSMDASIMINEYKPVPLSSLDIFAKEYSNPIGFKSGIEDNVGNIHSNVLVGLNQISYYIHGDYATISGVGFTFKEFTNSIYDMDFAIYGDNMEELYHLKLGVGEIPQEFCINIEGVEVLTIYLSAGCSMAGWVDEFAGIGELYLNKVP